MSSAHLIDGTTFLSYTFDGAAGAGEVDAGPNDYGATMFGSSLASVSGLLGNARRFSTAAGAFLMVGLDSGEVTSWGSEFTVEWRMKLRELDAMGDPPSIFLIGGVQAGNGPVYKAHVYLDAGTSHLRLDVGGGPLTSASVDTGYAVPLDVWRHYALVSYDVAGAQQLKLYVDGVEAFDSTPLALGLPGPEVFWDELAWDVTPRLSIGANLGEEFFPEVDFDDFCIRTDSRSALQVSADVMRGLASSLALGVQAPALGFTAGDEFLWSWTTTGLVPMVKLELSTDGGNTWTALATAANAGSYSWTAPDAATDRAMFRVSDAWGFGVTSASLPFTVRLAFPGRYTRMLKQLLPPGNLWTSVIGSTLNRVLAAVGDELSRVETRGTHLLAESDPRTALETLEDWERMVGLPDEDVQEIPDTTAKRRLAILQKVIRTGGQSAAYYVAVAAACGYTVTVYDGYGAGILRAGFRAGARCYGVDWAHVWRMDVEPPAGVALSQAELERIITRISPAHTVVLFVYS